MIKEIIQNEFNAQLVREMYSSNLYLSMSAYFDSIFLKGFAHWFRIQAQEELAHAMKFFDHILERGGRVKIGAISAPPSSWNSPLEAMEDALRHEQLVTAHINELTRLSIQENDYAANVFLQWFITEQVEEEAIVGDVVERLKIIGDWKAGLLMIDSELGKRTSEEETESEKN
ncbi:MAG: ferritin [Ignavibacteria bacterium]|nr:ferritin [Ignavibacteria bacterium]